MSQSLSDFVRDALSRGMSRDDITSALLQGGWSSKEIEAALGAFVEGSFPVPVPRKRVSSSPKEAFFLLVMFTALYTTAFALGSVLFDLLNLALPEQPQAWLLSSLRVGVASTVVAFPVFLLMCRFIAQETLKNPGQKISPIRRWLTYLTLFVASTAVVSDLITLIVSFLGGELTLRFALKAAVVALLAGSAFAYYLQDLRQDETAPSTVPAAPRPRAKAALLGLVSAVAAVVAVALWFAGSPMRVRLLAQDAQRVQDLATIQERVQTFYQSKGTLPASLAACDPSPDTYIEQKTDRHTGEPYVYRVLDPTHVELGATFALASAPGEVHRGRAAMVHVAPGEEGFWRHGTGRHTFTVEVRKERP